MPGFVDTHHRQFETALCGFLADGLLTNDGKPHGAVNYFDYILGKFARRAAFGPDNLFIHMTGIFETGWKATKHGREARSVSRVSQAARMLIAGQRGPQLFDNRRIGECP
jgi:hypothetical protein